MQDLINLINELSEKYKFDEADIKRVQEAVFNVEQGGITNADLDKEDFVQPEGFDMEEGDVDGEAV